MKRTWSFVFLLMVLITGGTLAAASAIENNLSEAVLEPSPMLNKLDEAKANKLDGGGQHKFCPYWVYGLSCNWFDGNTVQFSPSFPPDDPKIASGYVSQGATNSGTWQCSSEIHMQLDWERGGYIDRVELIPTSLDIVKLEGINQYGTKITAQCTARWAGEEKFTHKRRCDIDSTNTPSIGHCSLWLWIIDEARRVLIVWPHWSKLPEKGKEIPNDWIRISTGKCEDMLARATQECQLWAPKEALEEIR